jgi:Replication protein
VTQEGTTTTAGLGSLKSPKARRVAVSGTRQAVPQRGPARAEGRAHGPARPPGRALGNYAINAYAPVADGAITEPRRLIRMRLRAHLWGLVKPGEHRVSKCGRVPLAGAPVLALADDGTAHMRGLTTCGSVSACPVCAAKIRQRRAEEIDEGLGRHLAGGGGAVFLTLTVPHDAGMPLEALWGAVAASWRSLVSGRHRAALRERFGLVGYVRATEITHGRAGWHPHLHVLLLTERPLSLDELRELHLFVRERWIRRVTAMGYRAPDVHKGVRILPV